MEQKTREMPRQSGRPVTGEGVGCYGRSAEEPVAETADAPSIRTEHRPLNTAEVEKRLEDAIVRRHAWVGPVAASAGPERGCGDERSCGILLWRPVGPRCHGRNARSPRMRPSG